MGNIIVEQNIPARMRDGVTLYADIYRPAETGRYPVLLVRVPYSKAGYGVSPIWSSIRAAQAGYAVIVQDTRGRFASEGQFEMPAGLPLEGPDGYDTVEWAASLPYSDGNVGMFGTSYFGWTQWAAAAQRPPSLRAISPMCTWSDFCDGVAYRGGAFELGFLRLWKLDLCTDTTMRQLMAAGAAPRDIMAFVRGVIGATDRLSSDGYYELPLNDLPSLRELRLSSVLSDVLDPGPGNQPAGCNVAHSQVAVPCLHIVGWYDVFLQGSLDNYSRMRTQGRHAFLLIGPWTHFNRGLAYGTTMGDMEFGFGASSMVVDLRGDMTALQLRWFDRWLKGIDNGVDREPPVLLFLTGENRWLQLDNWPPEGARGQAMYLRAGGALGASPASDPSGTSKYTYEPANPAPTRGGNLFMPNVYQPGVKDQRFLSARPDVLTFVADPLEEPLTAMGRVTANLWASSSAPDTDFVARLLDVHPDGYMENLCDGIVRARYRNSLQKPEWLDPGVAYPFRIDLWSIAHTFKPGHRIGLQVTSSSFPRWDRNWNTKEDPGAAASGQPAQQTIYHDAQHPSHVVVPLTPAQGL